MQSLSTYKYVPLKQNQIRVLCLLPLGRKDDTPETIIECEIMVVSIHDDMPYEGLSYVWGDPKQTETLAVIQNTSGQGRPQSCTFPVTPSLWEALRHLRYKDEPRFLWVDQICINQDDTSEKNHQVSRMGEIYSRATCTVIWLGPKGSGATLLEDMYKELSTSVPETRNRDHGGVQMLDQAALSKMLGTSSLEEDKNEMVRDRRAILLQFLNVPWFTRAWVYQEAVTAPKVDVVWGKVVLPFDFVTGLVVSAYAIAKGNDDRRWHRRIKSTRGFSALRAIFHDRFAHREGELDFLNVLWHARKHLEATNHQDYVYAFLSINKNNIKDRTHPSNAQLNYSLLLQNALTPDYNASVEEVYTQLARAAILTTRSLDILQYVVPTKKSHSTNYRLPTWVPNWANKKFVCGSPIYVPGVPWRTTSLYNKNWAPEPISRLSSDNTLTSQELPTRGFILGRVEMVFNHGFKHTYFSSTLKNALRIDDLTELIKTEIAQSWSSQTQTGGPAMPAFSRTTVFKTVLADGAFTHPSQLSSSGAIERENPLSNLGELIAAYDAEKETIPPQGEDDEGETLRNRLRQMAEVAAGKRVFLMKTEGTGIVNTSFGSGGVSTYVLGLGFSTIKRGDLVCVLFGCKAPCILRLKMVTRDADGTSSSMPGRGEERYKVVGMCFAPSTGGRYRSDTPQRFVLV
ncbi:Heterokaryon incompatibility protein (HET) domain containing protein [Naviculisporaceae sp. PSN 640]